MSEIVPFGQGSELSRGEVRRAGKTLAKGKVGTTLRVASADNEADIAMAKADAITAVTGAGMTAVARVAQAQVQLEQMAPQAATRLNMIADAHSMTLVDLMTDLARKVRRL